MPVYEIKSPDGNLFEVRGERPPTEVELKQLFSGSERKVAPVSEAQARQAGAVPGVAITPQQMEIIRRGGEITPPERSLQQDVDYRPLQLPEAGGASESFASGAKLGMASIGAGLAKAVGAVKPGDIDPVMAIEQAKNKAIAEESPGANLAGQVVGEIAALPTLGPVGKKGAARILTGTAAGAAAGGLSASGRGDDAVNAALTGAGVSFGLGGLTEAGASMVRRLINAKGGKFATEDMAEIVRLGKENNIPVFVDDISDSPIVQKLGVLAENVPVVGTVKGRQKQNLLQAARAAELAKKTAGDISDFGVELQSELGKKLTRVRQKGSELFDRAARELDPKGPISKTNFKAEIEAQIAAEAEKGTRANKDLISLLESFRDAPDGDFSVIRSQRSDLGDEISQFYKGENQVIGAKGADKLQAVKNALEKDIEEFVKSSGGEAGKKLFRVANQYHQNQKLPFMKTQLKALIKTDEPEKIVSWLTGQGGRKSRADLLYKSLPPSGRRVVKAALIDKAVDKATSGKLFSPVKFSSELEKLSNVTGVFFRGADAREIEGIKKLMKATGRAGQIAENPPTGARLFLPGVGAVALTDLGTTIASIGGYGAVVRILYQTERGRALLSGLRHQTPGTKSFDNVINNLNRLLTRAAITSQTAE